MLLGSRGGEAWLAQGTFGNNMYDLPGLDPEAASTLADLILERNGATKYRSDDELLHLLKLLDGFPLALEVVLPNLARQAPKEVLSALQVGDVDLDTGEAEDNREHPALHRLLPQQPLTRSATTAALPGSFHLGD